MTSTQEAGTGGISSAAVVDRYLDAFYRGDLKTAGTVLADEFAFRGPFVEVAGRAEFLAGAEGLRRIVRGHRIVRRWVDGDEVCSIYDVAIESPAGRGDVTMSEWHRLRDGQIVSGRVLFDSAALRLLLPVPSDSRP
jgi:ketosteroid isomerase-like protein